METPPDTENNRKDFLDTVRRFSNFIAMLRKEKMKVYGMSWMRRSWDSLYQNISRKYDIVDEIMWGKMIKKRETPKMDEVVYLADGLLDLANYSLYGLWLIKKESEKNKIWEEVKRKIEERSEIPGIAKEILDGDKSPTGNS